MLFLLCVEVLDNRYNIWHPDIVEIDAYLKNKILPYDWKELTNKKREKKMGIFQLA